MKWNKKVRREVPSMDRDVTLLTFAFSPKSLYRNFSSRSQIHLILRNVVQVSGHEVTNKPISELTQTSRERYCTFCHFHFLSRERRNKLFTKTNIAFYVTSQSVVIKNSLSPNKPNLRPNLA